MGKFILLYIPEHGDIITEEMKDMVSKCADYLKDKSGCDDTMFVIAESVDTLCENKQMLKDMIVN